MRPLPELSVPVGNRWQFLPAEYCFPTPGRGSVAFQCRTANDITVGFHPVVASHLFSQEGRTDMAVDYEVVIGGWMNTKTAIRKNGILRTSSTKADTESAVIQSKTQFSKYWVNIADGLVTIGKGDLGEDPFLSWQDPEPANLVRFVCVCSWNQVATYRNIRVGAALPGPVFGTHDRKRSPHMVSPYCHIAPFACNSRLSDLTLQCGSAMIPAHRVVLAGWSARWISDVAFVGPVVAVDSRISYQDLNQVLVVAYGGAIEVTQAGHYAALATVAQLLFLPALSELFLLREQHVKKQLRDAATRSTAAVPTAGNAGPASQMWPIRPNFAQFVCSQSLSDVAFEVAPSDPEPVETESGGAAAAVADSDSDEDGMISANADDAASDLGRGKRRRSRELQETAVERQRRSSVARAAASRQTHSSSSAYVGPVLIPGHRLLLSGWEPFAAMFFWDFREQQETTVSIRARPGAFRGLLEFLYVGELGDEFDYMREAAALVELSDMFCVSALKVACCEFLRTQITAANVCQLLAFGSLHDAPVLTEACLNVLGRHFDRLLRQLVTTATPLLFGPQNPGALHADALAASSLGVMSSSSSALSPPSFLAQRVVVPTASAGRMGTVTSSMQALAASPVARSGLALLDADQLDELLVRERQGVLSHSVLFLGILTWGLFQSAVRVGVLPELLARHCALGAVTLADAHYAQRVAEALSSDDLRLALSRLLPQHAHVFLQPVSERSAASQDLIAQELADEFDALGVRTGDRALDTQGGDGDSAVNAGIFSNSSSSSDHWVVHRVPFSIPFECAGICYFFGTAFGSSDWVNPHSAGRLRVSASSLASRFTDFHQLVDRSFKNTSYAANSPAWWMVDFGSRCRVVCTHYSLQHDGSNTGFLRNWRLEGSNDAKLWHTLRRHHNDTSLLY
eukprot:TRINITY_DN1815_c1_g1_i3.p1 TRINITY_DN1815_c1_g1~~TRINITY_DN1815_c1_g1_i3.p1  ORF type:complete len:914 (-),score=135.87 TRINITY_DN1815_c1_g1_i3:315-3056(-)